MRQAKWQQVMAAAADWYRENPSRWIKNNLYRGENRPEGPTNACLWGNIRLQADRQGYRNKLVLWNKVSDYVDTSITTFNDHDSTSFEDVMATLDALSGKGK